VSKRLTLVLMAVFAVGFFLYFASDVGEGDDFFLKQRISKKTYKKFPEKILNETSAKHSNVREENLETKPEIFEASLPLYKDDRFVTGVVLDQKGNPIPGALVYFLKNKKMKTGIWKGFIEKQEKKYQTHEFNKKLSSFSRGNTKAVRSDAQGHFKIRWPRKQDSEKHASKTKRKRNIQISLSGPRQKGREEDISKKIEKDEKEDMPDWEKQPLEEGPQKLRIAHRLFLPAVLPVHPDQELRVVLSSSGGVRFIVKNEEGKALEGVHISRNTDGFDVGNYLGVVTNKKGEGILLLKPGCHQFRIGHRDSVEQEVSLEIGNTLETHEIELFSGSFITGRTVDAQNFPVENVHIAGSSAGKKSAGFLSTRSFPDSRFSVAVSTYDGLFRLGPFAETLLPDYQLIFEHDHYQTKILKVTAVKDLGDVLLKGLSACLIRVFDEDGKALAKAKVYSLKVETKEDFSETREDKDFKKRMQFLLKEMQGEHPGEETDEKGEILLFGQGRHYLYVYHEDFAPLSPVPEIVFPEKDETSEYRVELNKGLSLTIKIMDASGLPLSGVRVRLSLKKKSAGFMESMVVGMVNNMAPDLKKNTGILTNEKGEAFIEHLTEGAYLLEIYPKDLPAEEKTIEINAQNRFLNFHLKSPAFFYGRVAPSLAGEMLQFSGNLGSVKYTEIDQEGAWKSPPLQPGKYNIKFIDSENAMGIGVEMFATLGEKKFAYDIKEGEVKELHIEEPPLGKIVVKITQNNGEIYRGQVTLLHDSVQAGNFDVGGKIFLPRPLGEGRYEFSRIPEGNWNLQVNVSELNTQIFPIFLSKDEQKEKDIRLLAQDARIRGVLQDVQGQPLQGVLLLYDEKNPSLPLARTSPDTKGVFEFDKVVSGKLLLKLSEGLGLGRQLKSFQAHSGENDLGVIQMAAGLRLTGHLNPVGGDLPFGLSVKLFRKGQMEAVQAVDLEGNFVFKNLSPEKAELVIGPMIGPELKRQDWDGRSEKIEIDVPGEKW
jgi:hypothetical protein